MHVRHFFFVLYNCLDYSPSQENGGVNQRLEKLEQLITTGTNIAWLRPSNNYKAVTYCMSLVWISKPAVFFALLFQWKPCHSRYFTIALLLRLSVLSWFQPIFVSFVTISAVLCGCFKAMSLVRILPEQGPMIICIINNKWNMLTCSYINSMFSFEHCIICFFFL